MNLPVPTDEVISASSELAKTRKLLCLVFSRADWDLLNEMLIAGQKKIPDMQIESVCSAIIAEACRAYREKK